MQEPFRFNCMACRQLLKVDAISMLELLVNESGTYQCAWCKAGGQKLPPALRLLAREHLRGQVLFAKTFWTEDDLAFLKEMRIAP